MCVLHQRMIAQFSVAGSFDYGFGNPDCRGGQICCNINEPVLNFAAKIIPLILTMILFP
jgi:hypothetical protein